MRGAGKGGVWLAVLPALALAAGCDRFDPPPPAGPPSIVEARARAREAMIAVMKAAEKATASCVAGELLWEADENVGATYGGEGFDFNPPPPTHFSRPCIPERCTPGAPDLAALRSATLAARAVVEASPDLRVPTYQGFVAMAEAMVSFADAAAAGAGKGKETRFSGFSMHYTTLAAAFREVVPDVPVPAEPPSLTTSLAVPEPGGDVCKGWRVPRLCDVRAVRVPRVIKWRADPPCIEVESVRK